MKATALLRTLLALLALCSLSALAAGNGKAGEHYQFGPRGSWVMPATPDYATPPPAGQVSDGSWALMYDQQVNVTATGDEQYSHIAYAIINEAGVESTSQIDLDVDPSYESLVIHSIQIVRNGVAIDQRPTARIAALPREDRLEEHIYDGRYNINIVLSDVRVGDVVEYEYSVRSTEQLFPGHYTHRESVNWSDPVHWQRMRFRYPPDRNLHYRFSGGETRPQQSSDGNHRELSFQWENLAPIPADEDRPRWYMPWATLEVSDFDDWSQPAHLISPLYHLDARPRPLLDAAVASLRQPADPADETVMRALRYVQGTVRYTSISLGRGGYLPTDPETVLKRAFGDCKDKSLLLATLLQRLGIDAQPVLVNTGRGRLLPQSLPTPYAFDHAIVRVRLGQATYWLDSTDFKQYSRLAALERPDYAYALSLAPASQGFETIEAPDPQSRLREVQTTMDLRDGLLKPAHFDVTTRYAGATADDMRAHLSDTSEAELSKSYLNYYARHYSSIRAAAPVSVDDDTRNDVLITHEHYVIDHPFTPNDKGELRLSLHTDELYDYSSPLKSAARTSPLALSYPNHVKQTIVALLPGKWDVSDATATVDDPAFHYRSSTRYEDRKLTLDYDYQGLADHVEIAALPQYLADRKKVYDDLDLELTHAAEASADTRSGKTADAPFAIAPAPFFVALLSLGSGIWLMRRHVYSYDPPPRMAAPGTATGIGGWLILPALAVITRPIMLAYVAGSWGRFINAKAWQGLPRVVDEPYGSLAHPMYLILLGLAGLALPFAITVAILFFRKRSSAPLLFSVMLVILLVYDTTVLAVIAAAGIDKSINAAEVWSQGIKTFLPSVLWCAYMLNSERVKATFTRRLDPLHAVPPPVQVQLEQG